VSLESQIQELKIEGRTLQSDNVNLYEKLQYVQNYQKNQHTNNSFVVCNCNECMRFVSLVFVRVCVCVFSCESVCVVHSCFSYSTMIIVV